MRDLKIYAIGVDIPEDYELTKEEEDKLAQSNLESNNSLKVNQILYKSGFKAGQEELLDDLASARQAVDTLCTMLDSFTSEVVRIRDTWDSEIIRTFAADTKRHYDALDYVLAELVGMIR